MSDETGQDEFANNLRLLVATHLLKIISLLVAFGFVLGIGTTTLVYYEKFQDIDLIATKMDIIFRTMAEIKTVVSPSEDEKLKSIENKIDKMFEQVNQLDKEKKKNE